MISPDFIQQLWYGNHWLAKLLLPVSWLYAGYMKLRYMAYTLRILPRRSVNVPVIVVGNLTVGGTGKTPLIIWLCHFLRSRGHRPGVISRGYGGQHSGRPQQVRPDSHPAQVGDEPVLIAQNTGCPVAIATNRYQAATELLEHTDCDVLLFDDGLQHLSMNRDLEIAVVDGVRRFGNGQCLPAGPLREPISRLATVDMVIGNGRAGRNEFLMQYVYEDLRSVDGRFTTTLEAYRGTSVHVVTGIGNPERFHSYIRSCSIQVIRHDFPDHHVFVENDLLFHDGLPVIMTEKDAIKCREFRLQNCWYIPITVELTEAFHHRLTQLLKDLFNG